MDRHTLQSPRLGNDNARRGIVPRSNQGWPSAVIVQRFKSAGLASARVFKKSAGLELPHSAAQRRNSSTVQ
jgi:hypothetical protein